MPISPEINKVMELINQKVAAYQEKIAALLTLKETLLKEFGLEQDVVEERVSYQDDAASSPKKTRKQMLIEFLNKNGPHSRKDIARLTSIPVGTIAFLLNDKETFERIEGNKWTVKKGE